MKIKIAFIPVIVLLLFLSSCGKYEEGPGFTVRTKTHRVVNSWVIEHWFINGGEVNPLVPFDYTETYEKDGAYSYTSSAASGSGTWEFQSDKAEIKRSGVSGQSTETLVILRLKEKEFWYYYMDGNDKHEFHLKQK